MHGSEDATLKSTIDIQEHFTAKDSPYIIITASNSIPYRRRRGRRRPGGLPSRTIILDRTYSAQRFFILVLFFFFYFRSCGRLSWLNCQLSRVH